MRKFPAEQKDSSMGTEEIKMKLNFNVAKCFAYELMITLSIHLRFPPCAIAGKQKPKSYQVTLRVHSPHLIFMSTLVAKGQSEWTA